VEKPQTFRSPTALVVWVVWLLFAVGNWVDLAVQGRDHTSVVAAAILLLATGIAYVTALRPRVIVGDTGVTIKNPVRDHEISWAAVTGVDLVDLMRIHCTLDHDHDHDQDQVQGQDEAQGQEEAQGKGRGKRKIISAWAVHYSRRRQLAADSRSRRAAAREAGGGRPSLLGGFSATSRGMSYGNPAATSASSSSETEAKMIVRLISERATAARAEALWAASPSGTSPPPPAPAANGATDAGRATSAGISAPANAATSATPANSAATVTSADPAPGVPAADVPVTGSTRPLTSTWSNSAIAAVVVPALILLIVILL
jgi:hypothetical protein